MLFLYHENDIFFLLIVVFFICLVRQQRAKARTPPPRCTIRAYTTLSIYQHTNAPNIISFNLSSFSIDKQTRHYFVQFQTIFSAFFFLIRNFLNPNRQQRATRAKTPLQLYVRRLMMEKLKDDPDVVESVIKQLRKLPWEVLHMSVTGGDGDWGWWGSSSNAGSCCGRYHACLLLMMEEGDGGGGGWCWYCWFWC